jgi:hypothetical protein
MSEDERIIANQILVLVQKRYKWQINRLQELLGVTDHFDERLQELWNRANSP